MQRIACPRVAVFIAARRKQGPHVRLWRGANARAVTALRSLCALFCLIMRMARHLEQHFCSRFDLIEELGVDARVP